MWPNAVSSLTYSNGVLSLTLNSDMLAHAVYPLYVDPTWTLSSTVGWGASTFQDAVVDQGDHTIKIGWLADNFNDNVNENRIRRTGKVDRRGREHTRQLHDDDPGRDDVLGQDRRPGELL